MSKCKRTLLETHQVDVVGKKCEAPSIDKSSLREYGVNRVDPRLPIAASSLFTTMHVSSVFRRESVWVLRRLSPQEIGSEMDLPVGLLKALSIVSQIDPLVMTDRVAMSPLKITQAAAAHIFFLSSMTLLEIGLF